MATYVPLDKVEHVVKPKQGCCGGQGWEVGTVIVKNWT